MNLTEFSYVVRKDLNVLHLRETFYNQPGVGKIETTVPHGNIPGPILYSINIQEHCKYPESFTRNH